MVSVQKLVHVNNFTLNICISVYACNRTTHNIKENKTIFYAPLMSLSFWPTKTFVQQSGHSALLFLNNNFLLMIFTSVHLSAGMCWLILSHIVIRSHLKKRSSCKQSFHLHYFNACFNYLKSKIKLQVKWSSTTE